jgi:pantetheine-phosphate adenylyltransferase
MTQTSYNRTALFAGSFNPFTIGHASIVERGLQLFDRIVIGIGVNANKPDSQADGEKRAAHLRAVYANEPRVEVITYSTLTVDAAQSVGAKFLLRGVRSARDFEYERDLADVNRRLSGIETVLLYALPDLAVISSSLVRELQSYGKDVANLMPCPLRNSPKTEC